MHAADAMISTILHELLEMATDPWAAGDPDENGGTTSGQLAYSSNTYGELGDVCAWTFPSMFNQVTASGALYNVKIPATSKYPAFYVFTQATFYPWLLPNTSPFAKLIPGPRCTTTSPCQVNGVCTLYIHN